MAITASVQPKSGRIVYAGSDFPHPFQFHFSKEGMDHIVQNRPGSDLDGLARVWLNSSGLEASRCAGIIGPGFWQDAIGSGMFTGFTQRVWNIHRSGVLTPLFCCYMAGATWNCSHLGARSVYTVRPYTGLQCCSKPYK